MEILDSETKSDRLSTVHQLRQTIALVETSSEEAEIMDLKKRPGLRSLIANRTKGATPPEAPKAQASTNLPLPPSPTDLVPIRIRIRENHLRRRKRGRCFRRGAQNNKRLKSLETRVLSLWKVETMRRYTNSSVHGHP